MKYIIDIEENPLCVFDKDTHTYFPRLWRVKGFNSLVFDEEGLSRLEELTADYINEHYGSLQDDAYQRGFDDAHRISEEEYHRGLEDAWEAARKIADMWTRIDNDELLAIFGITERIGHSTIRSMFEKQTANEAMLELEAYEEKQKAEDEIKVGDEVKPSYSDIAGVVTLVDGDTIYVLWRDGSSTSIIKLKDLRKTGRHFDIASILKEMQND